jgi:hypothetical protein
MGFRDRRVAAALATARFDNGKWIEARAVRRLLNSGSCLFDGPVGPLQHECRAVARLGPAIDLLERGSELVLFMAAAGARSSTSTIRSGSRSMIHFTRSSRSRMRGSKAPSPARKASHRDSPLNKAEINCNVLP